ncbi:MAG: hypothetical protein ACODAQ_01285 [Phycisphaeraceae bacterium]
MHWFVVRPVHAFLLEPAMFFFRRFGKIICGSATPAQLMLACVLGALLGFMPGLWQAAGVLVLLTVLLVLLNANLALAAIVGLIAKLVSIPLLPVSFAIGRVLLDGPTEPLFRWLINTPVLALFGFEYYVTTGGLVLGLVFGLVVGALVSRGVGAFRRRIASLEEGSERFKQWESKRWVRTLLWVLFGGIPKGGFQAVLERHGKVIRPLGIIAAAGVVALVVVVEMLFADAFVTAALQGGLERANGATVDVERAELDLKRGRLSIEGLAMADPNALERNLLQAAQLTADVSSADLLRKRLTLDNLTLNDAATGTQRAARGRLVGRPTRTSPPPEPDEDEKNVSDYLEDWETLKQRLAQIRRWMERIASSDEEAEEVDPDEPRPTLEERLKQRIATSGYANVAATHLVAEVPTFTLRALDAERVRAVQLDDELLNIHAQNLSTHPHLLDEPPRISITTADSDKLRAELDMAGASRQGGDSRVDFHYKGLPVERVTRSMQFAGSSPLEGGTMDLAMSGALGAEVTPTLDLPLDVTLHDTNLRVGGKERHVEQFTLSLGLRGPIDNPAIALDERKLAENLAKAGAGELARETLKDKTGVDLQNVLGGGGDDEEASEDEDGGDDVGGALRNLLRNRDDD